MTELGFTLSGDRYFALCNELQKQCPDASGRVVNMQHAGCHGSNMQHAVLLAPRLHERLSMGGRCAGKDRKLSTVRL